MSCENFNKTKDYITCDKRKEFVIKEKKKTFRLQNEAGEKICQVKIDDGYIDDKKHKKCDYGFWVCQRKQAFLVELKGSHIRKAVEQILSTLNLLKNELKDHQVNARIVVSKVNPPDIHNHPSITKLRKQLKQRKQGTLKYQANQLTEVID